MPTFHWRKKIRLGPFYVWLTRHGISSWGIGKGRTSHNFTHNKTTIDTPGPGYVSHKWGRKKGRR